MRRLDADPDDAGADPGFLRGLREFHDERGHEADPDDCAECERQIEAARVLASMRLVHQQRQQRRRHQDG